ncbi:MAG: IS66 family transposase [Firmicutes bacterium]|nr:IS66 family transposase [Bacillota bacterium]
MAKMPQPPQSVFGLAINNRRNQRDKPAAFLQGGRPELDNNCSERIITRLGLFYAYSYFFNDSGISGS